MTADLTSLSDRDLVVRLRHALREHDRVANMQRPSPQRRATARAEVAARTQELGRRLSAGEFEAWDALGLDCRAGAPRRRTKAGTAYYDRARERWVTEITVAGTRTRKLHRTEESAETWLRQARERAERGADVAASAVTVREWLTARLEAWSMNLRPKTMRNHRDAVTRWWGPRLGSIRLLALRVSDVEAVIQEMSTTGLSPNSIRIALAPLIKALNEAVKDPHVDLTTNVASAAARPRVEEVESDFLTPEEARALLARCAEATHGDVIAVAMLLGLRRGEALGLRWSVVDLEAERPTATIEAMLTRTQGHLVWELTTKTARKGRRTIVLPRSAVSLFRARRVVQNEHRLAAGEAWSNDHGLVFTTVLGTPIDPDSVTKATYRLTEKSIGRRLGPHALRHTAATLLHDAGISAKVAQRILGHSTESMTSRVYTHTLDSQLERAAAAIDAIVAH